MFALRSRNFARDVYGVVRAARGLIAPVVVACLVAGCGASAQTYDAERVAVVPHGQDVEDDGLPAQTPPSARIRNADDDPSEPYSPNYGGPNYGGPNYGGAHSSAYRQSSRSQSLPDDLPPKFKALLVAAAQGQE